MRWYKVDFPDSMVKYYTANITADLLYQQVYGNGKKFILSDGIAAIKNYILVLSEYEALISKNGAGNNHQKPTTKGWQILVTQKNGLY